MAAGVDFEPDESDFEALLPELLPPSDFDDDEDEDDDEPGVESDVFARESVR